MELIRQALLPLWTILAVAASTSAGLADDATLSAGRAEMENAVKSLRPRPSLDSTPIEFSIAGVRYRMPRNYLTTMDNWDGGPQGLVTVTVNIPDLAPLSHKTFACFTAKPTLRPPGCEPLSFIINAPGRVSADEAFKNMAHLFLNKDPLPGPYGYQEYELGPDSARTDYYRMVKDGRILLYACQMFENNGKHDGLCRPISDRVASGSDIQFFFNLGHLVDIAGVDASLRKLTDHFTVQVGARK